MPSTSFSLVGFSKRNAPKCCPLKHQTLLIMDISWITFKKPVIFHDYPKGIKAFYMKLSDDMKIVAAMDVLVPKVGFS